MKRIVFATNNAHKLEELRRILPREYDVVGLRDIGCEEDIPENESTFEGNALSKASWVKNKYGLDCIADDSGLEVEALQGRPGVHSARYAGAEHDDAANRRLLLENLEKIPSEKRAARFRTSICLLEDDKEPRFFDGVVNGRIIFEERGEGGFGYDSIFVPDGFEKTFAEMPPEEKDAISHRGRAVRKLVEYFEKLK